VDRTLVATPSGEVPDGFGSEHEDLVLRDIDLAQISHAKQVREH
jgi:hypothetical protein